MEMPDVAAGRGGRPKTNVSFYAQQTIHAACHTPTPWSSRLVFFLLLSHPVALLWVPRSARPWLCCPGRTLQHRFSYFARLWTWLAVGCLLVAFCICLLVAFRLPFGSLIPRHYPVSCRPTEISTYTIPMPEGGNASWST